MSVLAWHFLAADRRLQHGDRRQVEIGTPIEVKGPPILCKWGLHASLRAIDALRYALGPIACRVKLDGLILRDTDKLVATRRTVLAWCDATQLLHRFACDVATDALDLAEERGAVIDSRFRRAVETKRAWLDGWATDRELAASWVASETATSVAATVEVAAWAVYATAGYVWAAARATVRDAAMDGQNVRLERLLIEEQGIHGDGKREGGRA